MPISAIDLFFQSDDDQRIIRCLTRHPNQALADIAREIALPLQKVEEIVMRMLREAKLIQSCVAGQTVFAVHYTREPVPAQESREIRDKDGKEGRKLPPNLFSLFE